MLSPLVEEDGEGDEQRSDEGGPTASPLPLQAPRVSWVHHATYLPQLLERSRVACEELSGVAHTRLARLSFGQALLQGLGKQAASRVSLVQAHVTHMDTPPTGVLPQPLLTLHLSRNALRTLHGVQPALLQSLTALSLAHNCIDDVTTFAFLGSACPGLTDLRLEGNPVCSLLDARAHAAAALPFLRTYDGREVTAPERRAAVAKVRREEASFDTMVDTAAMLLALEAADVRRRVHAAIRRVGPVNDTTAATQPGTTRHLLALWDMPRRIPHSEKRALLRALRCECRRLSEGGEPVPLVALEQTLATALEDGLAAADVADEEDAVGAPPGPDVARVLAWGDAHTRTATAPRAAQPLLRATPRQEAPAVPRSGRTLAELLASPPPSFHSLRTLPATMGSAATASPLTRGAAAASPLGSHTGGGASMRSSPPTHSGGPSPSRAAASPTSIAAAASPPRPRVGSPKPSAAPSPAGAVAVGVSLPSKERTLWLEIQSLRTAAAASAALEVRLTKDNERLRQQCAESADNAALSVATAEEALASMQEHMRASLDAQHQAMEDSARARTAAQAAQAAERRAAETSAAAEARAAQAAGEAQSLREQLATRTAQRDDALAAAEAATAAHRAVSMDIAAANARLEEALGEVGRLHAVVDSLTQEVHQREQALGQMAHMVTALHSRADGLAAMAMRRERLLHLRTAFRAWKHSVWTGRMANAGAELSGASRRRESMRHALRVWVDQTRSARRNDVAAHRAGALHARSQLARLRRVLHAWSRLARAGSSGESSDTVAVAIMAQQVETLAQRLEGSEQEQRLRDDMQRHSLRSLEQLALEKQRLMDVAIQEARARATAAEQRSAEHRREAQAAARAASLAAASTADAAVADAMAARREAAAEVSKLRAALDEAQRAASLAQASANRAQRERDSALSAHADGVRREALRERRLKDTFYQRSASPVLHAASRSRPASPTRSVRGSSDTEGLQSLGPPMSVSIGAAFRPSPPPFLSAVASSSKTHGRGAEERAPASPALDRARKTTLRVARVRV